MGVSRVAGLLLCVGSTAVLAQNSAPTPQFRAGVELLQLDVTVLDDKRQPVRGLTASDFTVLDNGTPTPIRAFTPVELHPGAGATGAVWSRDVPPDVANNQAGEEEGRLVIILLDRTIPVEQPTVTARKIATAAVEALGPNDLAAVVSTSNGGPVQNLTADRARLLRAINDGDPSRGLSPEQEAVFGKQDPLRDPRCLCGLCSLEAVTRVAEALENTPRRRKLLLFIGSSMIWQAHRPADIAKQDVGCEGRLEDARNMLFAAVDRANLTVHAIDPQGLVNLGPQVRAGIGGGFDRPVNSGPAVRLRQQQTDTNDALTGQQSLQVLPERTGGRTVVGRNDAEQVVPSIFRESEAYYVLAIERGLSARADRTRAIEVKVGRRGLKAYTQRKYVTPSPQDAAVPGLAAPASTQESLTRLLPNAGLPLGLRLSAFASPDTAKAVVRVLVDAGAFARPDGTATPLDVAVIAVDPTGKSLASARQTSTISGGRPGADRLPEAGIASHLELDAGAYEIRAAVSDPASGRMASVFSEVTVPRFDTARLSLSDINVEVSSSRAAPPAPTLRRLFRRTDQVRAVLQIYQGTQRTDAIVPVSMRVQILDGQGAAIRDQSLPFTEQTFTNRRADCVVTLPLASLTPGEYLLRLNATLDRETTGRALRFRVE